MMESRCETVAHTHTHTQQSAEVTVAKFDVLQLNRELLIRALELQKE